MGKLKQCETWLPIIRLIGDARLGKQHIEPIRLRVPISGQMGCRGGRHLESLLRFSAAEIVVYMPTVFVDRDGYCRL